MSVSQRLRFEIIKRDRHTCRYCGAKAPEVRITVDHVIPTALGGSDDPTNLVAACKDCNGGKSSVSPDASLVADVAEDALRMAEAIRQVAEMRSAEIRDRLALLEWFRSVWTRWTCTCHDRPYRADGDATSIPLFIENGLTVEDLEDLVGVAMGSRAKDKWKYFCGCCWQRIRDTQDQAIKMMAAKVPEDDIAAEVAARIEALWDDAINDWRQLVRERPNLEGLASPDPCIHVADDPVSLRWHCGDLVCMIFVAGEMKSCVLLAKVFDDQEQDDELERKWAIINAAELADELDEGAVA